MKMSASQVRALSAARFEAFVRRAIAFVQEIPGPPIVEAEARALIERARGYGLTFETSIVSYLLAARVLGSDFDQRHPRARHLLEQVCDERYKAEDLRRFCEQALSTPNEAP